MDNFFNIISTYLPAGYIIICLGLIVVGEMLKKFTVLPNQLLTTTLPILGAIVIAINYISTAEVFETSSLIQQICVGLLLGWAATGGFEWFKNTFINKPTTIKTIGIVEKEQISEEEQNQEIEAIGDSVDEMNNQIEDNNG